MNTYRTLTTLGGLFLTASQALAQYAPAAPPAPPTPRAYAAPRAMPAPAAPVVMYALDETPPVPPAAPRPAAAPSPQAVPMPAMPTMPPMAPSPAALAQDVYDRLATMPIDIDTQVLTNVQVQLENLQNKNFDFQWSKDTLMEQQAAMAKAEAQIASAYSKIGDSFNYNGLSKSMAMQARAPYAIASRGSEDGMYQTGLNAIDNHQYEQALSEFNTVASRAGTRAEGALYWKAYVLNKLGRASEAQAAIETLRKNYPNGHWLDDAKALELEVKQSKGPVSADAETDEDIKVLALNVVMQSDPEKALPQVENMLKGTHSPKLKRQALYVIAQSGLPKAQQDLEQIARGGNPDLQITAIRYLSQKRNPNTPQILQEIYTSTSDPAVKQAILSQFMASKDKDRILGILRNEKDANLRTSAIHTLGDVDGQPELWQIYQSETTTEGKISVLNAMLNNGNLEKLAEVARTDKDPKVRQKAIQVIGTQQSGTPSTTLVSLYAAEQDEKVKQSIIDNLSGARNCQPLVDLAKAEKSNMQMKMRIVQRLAGMKSCPAGNEYLMELLNK